MAAQMLDRRMTLTTEEIADYEMRSHHIDRIEDHWERSIERVSLQKEMWDKVMPPLNNREVRRRNKLLMIAILKIKVHQLETQLADQTHRLRLFLRDLDN